MWNHKTGKVQAAFLWRTERGIYDQWKVDDGREIKCWIPSKRCCKVHDRTNKNNVVKCKSLSFCTAESLFPLSICAYSSSSLLVTIIIWIIVLPRMDWCGGRNLSSPLLHKTGRRRRNFYNLNFVILYSIWRMLRDPFTPAAKDSTFFLIYFTPLVVVVVASCSCPLLLINIRIWGANQKRVALHS